MSDWSDGVGFGDGGGGIDWSNADWGSLAGAAGGLYNMFSGSPTSSRGILQNAASAADPFGGLRGMAQGQLGDALSSFKNTPASLGFGQAVDSLGGRANLSGINPQLGYMAQGLDNKLLGSVEGMAGPQMDSFLQMMGTNDPSMGFRYQQGLDALGRGAAATGTLASGKQLQELEQYGQGFASQEFGNMFARQSQLQQLENQTQQQGFAQGAQKVQLDEASRQRQFDELAQFQQMNTNREMGQFAQQMEGAQFQQQGTMANLSKQGLLLQQLAGLSTAGAGNASESGQILAGRYQQNNQAQSDVGGGVGGFLGSLGGAVSGIASIASLF